MIDYKKIELKLKNENREKNKKNIFNLPMKIKSYYMDKLSNSKIF